MTPAKFKVMTIQISISKEKDYYFVTTTDRNIFPGFLRVYNIQQKEEESDYDGSDSDSDDSDDGIEKIIPPKVGTVLNVGNVTGVQDYQRPPARYSETTLGKKLEILEIGRPATYATIYEKILSKNYVALKDNNGVEKDSITLKWDGDKYKESTNKILLGKDKNRYAVTAIGRLINDFLVEYFTEIMDYDFTAHMEKQLDKIAKGKLNWIDLLHEFYDTFKPLADKVSKTIKPKEIIDKHARDLGKHPDTGKKIIATIAKYGPIVKMADGDGDDKFIMAPIKEPLTLKSIQLKDALKLFEYPKKLGKHQRCEVTLNKGQYGFYLKVGSDKVALKIKEEDVDDFTLKDAIKEIDEKNKRTLWQGKDEKNKYIILDGPHGKYINVKPLKGAGKSGKKGKNCHLPDGQDIESLTLEKVKDIIKNSFANRFGRGKKDGKDGKGKDGKDGKDGKGKDSKKDEKPNKVKKNHDPNKEAKKVVKK